MKTFKFIGFTGLALSLLSIIYAANSQTNKSQILQQMVETKSTEQLPSTPNTAFKEGEILTYRLHYDLLNAGNVVLEEKPDI
ncbi:MAG TPA: hypothetical protein PL029_07040, partial [Bacteroidia bacterium]|nr:hypothetical protein [Bacteroidia bacterium]